MTKENLINIINDKTLRLLKKKVIKNIINTQNKKILILYYNQSRENYSSLEEVIKHFNIKYNLKLFKKDYFTNYKYIL